MIETSRLKNVEIFIETTVSLCKNGKFQKMKQTRKSVINVITSFVPFLKYFGKTTQIELDSVERRSDG